MYLQIIKQKKINEKLILTLLRQWKLKILRNQQYSSESLNNNTHVKHLFE